MKKLMIAACMMLGFAGIATAQQAVKATPGKKAKMEMVKKDAPAAKVVKMEKAAPAMKADGTPDMRFKANKGKAAKATGPTKKDGTPDKRFKANKKGN